MKYHDEEAIESGRRERGDKTGIIVSVRGQHMVCAERVDFCMTLPGTKPISLEEAKIANEQSSKYGWRALTHKGSKIEWFTFHGHPVVRYVRENGDSTSTLFWKMGKTIHEQWLDDDVHLDPVTEQVVAKSPTAATELPQLAFAF